MSPLARSVENSVSQASGWELPTFHSSRPPCAARGGVLAELSGVVVTLLCRGRRNAVGHGEQVAVATGTAIAQDGLFAHPVTEGSVGIGGDVAQHLLGGGVGQTVTQAIVRHVALEFVTTYGSVVDLLEVTAASSFQGTAHGAIAGLGRGQRRCTKGRRGQQWR